MNTEDFMKVPFSWIRFIYNLGTFIMLLRMSFVDTLTFTHQGKFMRLSLNNHNGTWRDAQ